MQAIYPYAQIIHVVLVIVFLGYVFTDVIILRALNGKFDLDTLIRIKSTIGQKAFKIMPFALLFIILTGGVMMSSYVGGEHGWWQTSMQKLFMIKVALACFILFGVIMNLSRKIMGKKPFGFMKNFHIFVLICGFFIVILAKTMLLV